MSEKCDILLEIQDENLPKLANLYEKHVKWAPHVLSLIHTGMRWKKSEKYKNCITFLSPKDTWQTDGTIVVLMQFHCYDIFVFTLDETGANLHQALTKTTKIDYKKSILFFCVHEKHIPVVMQAIEDKKLKIDTPISLLDMWVLAPEKANFAIDCPPDVYVKKLEPCLANQIDAVWPHRYPGSQNYLEVLIEMNGGWGLFLKETDEMVSWIVKHCFGHMGMLQTEEKYKRRGFGALVTKCLAKEIAEEGNWPFGTVYQDNVGPLAMLEKLGFEFEKIGTCTYIIIKHD